MSADRNPAGLRIVVAVGRDGSDVRVMAIPLRVLSEDARFDLETAVSAACTEYVRTPEGKAEYEANCGDFDWADFAARVPDRICRKHGFERIQEAWRRIDVDKDEHLVDDFALESDE